MRKTTRHECETASVDEGQGGGVLSLGRRVPAYADAFVALFPLVKQGFSTLQAFWGGGKRGGGLDHTAVHVVVCTMLTCVSIVC